MDRVGCKRKFRWLWIPRGRESGMQKKSCMSRTVESVEEFSDFTVTRNSLGAESILPVSEAAAVTCSRTTCSINAS